MDNQNSQKIIDSSGDRKYFTMIPNYIVNHSTAYEQSLYLVMKRMAGEKGTCWASPTTIGEIMDVCPNTVRKNQEKLIKRGWIRIIGSKGKTKPTNEFEIVDLWKLNMEFYAKKDCSVGEQSIKENSTGEENVQQVNLVSSPNGNEEEINKEELLKKKNIAAIKKVTDYESGKKGKEKPYYDDQEMRWSKNRWWVIPKDGGDWLKYEYPKLKIDWK